MLNYDQIMALVHDVEIAQRLGVDRHGRALVLDSIPGPLTRGGSYLDPRAITTPIANVALGELLAKAEEVGGNNRGERVATYCNSDDWQKDHGPWCAQYASWCGQEAHGEHMERCPGARRLVLKLRDYEGGKIEPGEIAPDDYLAWDRESDTPFAGHVAICVAIEEESGAGKRWVWVIDGNKNVPGAPRRHRKGQVRAWRFDAENLDFSKTSRFLYAGRPQPDGVKPK